jgi:ubiquinone/menaquinone biosynthesis C-methylase UbiE
MNRVISIGVLAFGLATDLSGVAARQLASRPAEEWIKTLEAPARVAGLKVDEVIARLRLKPRDVVADLGAGSGLFAFPLARAVPAGRVYAVELDEGFLTHIRGRAQEQRITNLQPVLGKFTDPALPARDVDLAFFHDVLHHVENRGSYLKSVAGYLRAGGRVAVIEFHPQQSPHREQPQLIVSKEETAGWLGAAGFAPVEEFDLFTDKWFVVYARR